MIGILCPSDFEYQALKDLHLPKSKTALVVSGMGKVRTIYACHALASKHKKLKALLLIGFAGGLTTGLTIGDVIEPSLFVEQDYDARPLEAFPHSIVRSAKHKLFSDSLDAAMLTQDRFLTENPYKKLKKIPGGKKHLACDMESYALAYFASQMKMRYSVIKLISDVADKNADHDFLKACRELAPKLSTLTHTAVKNLG